MQHAGRIANATGVHGHIDDLLLDLRRLTGIAIRQQRRVSNLGRAPADVSGAPHPDGTELGGAQERGARGVWRRGAGGVATPMPYGPRPPHRWGVARLVRPALQADRAVS